MTASPKSENTIKIYQSFSWIQKYTLKKYHPQSIFINTIGLLWFTYYLWNHKWELSLCSIGLSCLLSAWFVRNSDVQKLSETVLGKIALLHINPINMIIQIIGFIVFAYGIWNQSAEVILGGISIILLGHLCGWDKVNPRFTLKKNEGIL